jgi:hypothetical protein
MEIINVETNVAYQQSVILELIGRSHSLQSMCVSVLPVREIDFSRAATKVNALMTQLVPIN